jgi:hypothetical protein
MRQSSGTPSFWFMCFFGRTGCEFNATLATGRACGGIRERMRGEWKRMKGALSGRKEGWGNENGE